jgi:AraC-like DNA-binding protein
MARERLRVWRPAAAGGAVCIHGVTDSYTLDPVGECVFGVVLDGAMEAHRGKSRHLFGPGDLCAWSPEGRHAGRAYRTRSWKARLVILELGALERLLDEAGGAVAFAPVPRIADAQLAAAFVRLHRALERPASALEVEGRLVAWLRALLAPRSPRAVLSASRAHADPALKRAVERLCDDAASNLTLSELAQAAGVDRHRLTRLFRAAYGLPPHRFQLARRLEEARVLIERGAGVAHAAAAVGFFDQSHLTRHFGRAFGFTPARYAALLAQTYKTLSARGATPAASRPERRPKGGHA